MPSQKVSLAVLGCMLAVRESLHLQRLADMLKVVTRFTR